MVLYHRIRSGRLRPNAFRVFRSRKGDEGSRVMEAGNQPRAITRLAFASPSFCRFTCARAESGRWGTSPTTSLGIRCRNSLSVRIRRRTRRRSFRTLSAMLPAATAPRPRMEATSRRRDQSMATGGKGTRTFRVRPALRPRVNVQSRKSGPTVWPCRFLESVSRALLAIRFKRCHDPSSASSALPAASGRSSRRTPCEPRSGSRR